MADDIPAALDGVGAPEIEITEPMLKAGIRVLTDEWGICMDDIAEGLALAVFRAMSQAR